MGQCHYKHSSPPSPTPSTRKQDWRMQLRELWADQTIDTSATEALKKIETTGASIRLFYGRPCTLQEPLIEWCRIKMDLLVGFIAHTPCETHLTLKINGKAIQDINMDPGSPVVAIGNAFPLSLIHILYDSPIQLQSYNDHPFEMTPIFAIIDTDQRQDLLSCMACYTPETESTYALYFNMYVPFQTDKYFCPDMLSASSRAYRMPRITNTPKQVLRSSSSKDSSNESLLV